MNETKTIHTKSGRIFLVDVFRARQSAIARAVLVRAGLLDNGAGWTFDGLWNEATKAEATT